MTGLPRWALVGIAASLILNLVGIGYLLGRATAGGTIAGVAQQERHIAISTGSEGQRHVIRIPPMEAPQAEIPPFPPVHPRAFQEGMGWIASVVPPERRGELAMQIELMQAPLLEEAEAIRTLREEITEALIEEPFERARLREALEQLRHHLLQTQQESHRVLIDIAAELEPEERAALAGRFSPYVMPAPEHRFEYRILRRDEPRQR